MSEVHTINFKKMNDEKKNVSTNGAYQNEDVLWHQHSNKLLIELMKYFISTTPVIDIGCGHNWYANVLKVLGYSALGVDRTWFPGVDVILDITNLVKESIDKRFIDGAPAKWNVLSLEVGEHIPAELAGKYLDNVCNFGGDVCMSWAVKGQKGIGHINCQNNDWVINEMYQRGYVLNHAKTAALRHAVRDCHCSWFVHTLMYFIPREKE